MLVSTLPTLPAQYELQVQVHIIRAQIKGECNDSRGRAERSGRRNGTFGPLPRVSEGGRNRLGAAVPAMAFRRAHSTPPSDRCGSRRASRRREPCCLGHCPVRASCACDVTNDCCHALFAMAMAMALALATATAMATAMAMALALALAMAMAMVMASCLRTCVLEGAIEALGLGIGSYTVFHIPGFYVPQHSTHACPLSRPWDSGSWTRGLDLGPGKAGQHRNSSKKERRREKEKRRRARVGWAVGIGPGEPSGTGHPALGASSRFSGTPSGDCSGERCLLRMCALAFLATPMPLFLANHPGCVSVSVSQSRCLSIPPSLSLSGHCLTVLRFLGLCHSVPPCTLFALPPLPLRAPSPPLLVNHIPSLSLHGFAGPGTRH